MNIPNPNKGFVQYERKIQPAQYESEGLTFSMEFDIPAEWGLGEIQAKGHEVARVLRNMVQSELGLIELDIANNPQPAQQPAQPAPQPAPQPQPAPAPQQYQVAQPAPQYAPTQAVHQIQQTFPGTQQVVGEYPPHTQAVTREEHAANEEWARARFATNPEEFWDNRTNKRNPKAPDIKHRNLDVVIWKY